MKNNLYIIISMISTIVVFLLLFLGFNVILAHNTGIKNISLTILSITIGVVLYIVLIYKQYIFITMVSLGLITSFIMMYYSFINNNMFGDIIGVLSFLIINLIGILSGILGQCIYYFFIRKKED